MRRFLATALFALTLAPAVHAGQLPRPDHVVIVIEENHGYAQIMDKRNRASYIHALAKGAIAVTNTQILTETGYSLVKRCMAPSGLVGA